MKSLIYIIHKYMIIFDTVQTPKQQVHWILYHELCSEFSSFPWQYTQNPWVLNGCCPSTYSGNISLNIRNMVAKSWKKKLKKGRSHSQEQNMLHFFFFSSNNGLYNTGCLYPMKLPLTFPTHQVFNNLSEHIWSHSTVPCRCRYTKTFRRSPIVFKNQNYPTVCCLQPLRP